MAFLRPVPLTLNHHNFSMVGISNLNFSANLFLKNRDRSISREKTHKARSSLAIMRGVFQV